MIKTIKRESKTVDIDRRAVLLGLGGAVALAAGKSGGALAQDVKEPVRKTIKEAESMIPGYAKVRLREFTYQPGEGINKAVRMPNDMVCEMARGSLNSVVDGKPVTRKTGDVWTCKTGMMIAGRNTGSTPAVMRIFDLLKA